MLLRCPHCASPEVTSVADRADMLTCENCDATFGRHEALISLAESEERSACTCSDVRGCPQCFQRADEMVGAIVRDGEGREWQVTDTDEKDGFPTVCGEGRWANLDEVTVLRRAAERKYTAAAFPLYADGKTGDQLASTHAPTIAGALADLGALLEACEVDPEAESLDVTLSWAPTATASPPT
jgi:hypothetical protein